LYVSAQQRHRPRLERFLMVTFRSASPDVEQPRSSQHLADDAELHADVKVSPARSPPPRNPALKLVQADEVAAAMGFKKPRRSIN
jgi:hypothetical protein